MHLGIYKVRDGGTGAERDSVSSYYPRVYAAQLHKHTWKETAVVRRHLQPSYVRQTVDCAHTEHTSNSSPSKDTRPLTPEIQRKPSYVCGSGVQSVNMQLMLNLFMV